MRVYSNTAAPTTLAGAIDDVADTLTLADATGYPVPAAGESALLQVEAELLEYTSLAGAVVSGITRGVDGTAAAAHADGVAVAHVASARDVEAAQALRAADGTAFPILQPAPGQMLVVAGDGSGVTGQDVPSGGGGADASVTHPAVLQPLAGVSWVGPTNLVWATGSNQFSSGVSYFLQYCFKRPASILSAGLKVMAAQSADVNARIGLRAQGADGFPGVLLQDLGIIATVGGSAGDYELSAPPDYALDANTPIWLEILADGNLNVQQFQANYVGAWTALANVALGWTAIALSRSLSTSFVANGLPAAAPTGLGYQRFSPGLALKVSFT